MFYFLPRGWRMPKKSANNRLPRDAGYVHWEFLLLSLNQVQIKSLRVKKEIIRAWKEN